jgi:hypothetical protein
MSDKCELCVDPNDGPAKFSWSMIWWLVGAIAAVALLVGGFIGMGTVAVGDQYGLYGSALSLGAFGFVACGVYWLLKAMDFIKYNMSGVPTFCFRDMQARLHFHTSRPKLIVYANGNEALAGQEFVSTEQGALDYVDVDAERCEAVQKYLAENEIANGVVLRLRNGGLYLITRAFGELPAAKTLWNISNWDLGSVRLVHGKMDMKVPPAEALMIVSQHDGAGSALGALELFNDRLDCMHERTSKMMHLGAAVAFLAETLDSKRLARSEYAQWVRQFVVRVLAYSDVFSQEDVDMWQASTAAWHNDNELGVCWDQSMPEGLRNRLPPDERIKPPQVRDSA